MKVLSDRTNKTCSPQHYFSSEPEKCFYCEGASLCVRGQQPSKMFKGQNNVWSTAKGADAVDKLSEGEATFFWVSIPMILTCLLLLTFKEIYLDVFKCYV